MWGLSNAQLASAGSVIAGVILLAWLAMRPANSPDEAADAIAKAA
jgi:hypothetical protein